MARGGCEAGTGWRLQPAPPFSTQHCQAHQATDHHAMTRLPTSTATSQCSQAHSPLRFTETRTCLHPHGCTQYRSIAMHTHAQQHFHIQICTNMHRALPRYVHGHMHAHRNHTQGDIQIHKLLGHTLWNTHPLSSPPPLLLLGQFLPQQTVTRTDFTPTVLRTRGRDHGGNA